MRVGIIENIDFSAVFHRFFFHFNAYGKWNRPNCDIVSFSFWFLFLSFSVLISHQVRPSSAGAGRSCRHEFRRSVLRFCLVGFGFSFAISLSLSFSAPHKWLPRCSWPGKGRLVHRWTQRIINRRHHNYWLTAGLQWTRDGVVISSLRLRVTLSLFQTLEFSLTRVDLYRYRFTRHLRVFRYLAELWGGKNALERLISSRKAVFLCRIQVLDPVELFIFRARIIFHVFVTSLRNEWFAGFHVGRGAA